MGRHWRGSAVGPAFYLLGVCCTAGRRAAGRRGELDGGERDEEVVGGREMRNPTTNSYHPPGACAWGEKERTKKSERQLHSTHCMPTQRIAWALRGALRRQRQIGQPVQVGVRSACEEEG